MNQYNLTEKYEKSINRINSSLGKLEAPLTYVVGLLFASVFCFVGYDLGGVGGAIGLGFFTFFMGAMVSTDFPNLITQLIGTLKRLGVTSSLVIFAFAMSRFFESLSFGLVLFIIVSVYVLFFRVVSSE